MQCLIQVCHVPLCTLISMVTLVSFKGCCGKVKDLELKMPFFSLDLMRFVADNHHIYFDKVAFVLHFAEL